MSVLRRLSRRIRSRSLRLRLVVGVVAMSALGLLVADAASVSLQHSYVDRRTQRQLVALQTRLRQMSTGSAPRNVMPAPARAAIGELLGGYVIETYRADGTLTARYTNERRPLPVLPPLATLRADGHVGRPFFLPGGDPAVGVIGYRALVWADPGGQGVTMVALDMSDPHRTTTRLIMFEAGSSLVVIVLIGILAGTVVRLGLRPLDEVENTAEAIITSGDPSRRIAVRAASGTEIGRLAATLNVMLERLSGALAQRAESEDRLRRFVADASHELRTPVAGIRGFAELYRHGVASGPDQVADVFARIEAEATRMGMLVEELLLLARLDQRRLPESEPVDLLPIAVDAVESARAIAPGRPLRLDILPEPGADGALDEPGAAPPVVLGDEAQLRQVASNLIGNALRHTPPDTPVVVRVGVPDGQSAALFEVVDHGPGLDPADADRVFERFYRADPARGRVVGTTGAPDGVAGRAAGGAVGGGAGAGLGLSIVAAVVTAHRGTVDHRPTPGGGATFCVRLPTGREPGPGQT